MTHSTCWPAQPTFQRLILGSACVLLTLASQTVHADDFTEGYSTRLYLANADGSDMKPLLDETAYKSQGSPSWSRDGKLIAFDGWRKTEKGGSAGILIVNADGTNLRELTDGAMPSLSPLGRRMAFSRYSLGSGIWIMSSEGPDAELVQIEERGWGTDWSPDGTRIAYTLSQDGANICIFNIVEGTRSFVFGPGESPYRQIFWNLAWSPDSRSIAFRGMRQNSKPELAVVSADGASQGLKVVLEANTLPAVSYFPDGRIVFAQAAADRGNRTQLFTVDPNKDEPPQMLSKLPEEYSYSDPAPSPNGDFIVFSRKPHPPATK